MNQLMSREQTWSPGPGARVRLRMGFDRPRALDGELGTVRYSWSFVSDDYRWLVALDKPVLDGRRAYTLILCSSDELEPVERLGDADVVDGGVRLSGTPTEGATTLGSHANQAQTSATNPSVAAQHAMAAPEIITYRRPSEFVGRAREIADFDVNLTLSLDDDRKRFVFNVFGPSGVGKTWLLRRYAASFQQAGGVTAWADDSEEDVVGVMEHIAGQFRAQGWSFASFDDELRRYRAFCRAPATDRHDAVNSSSAGLLPRSTEERALASTWRGRDVMAEENRDGEIDLARSAMDPRFAILADPRPMQRAIRVLTPLFLEGLRSVAADWPIGLFFDGYEKTGRYLDPWLARILDGEYGDLPGSTIVVIAGQVPLDGFRWANFDPVVARVPLGPLSPDETRAFLVHHWILDARVARTIQQVSGRLPVLVATMAMRASDHLERLTDPTRTAVDCFLASLGDPVRRSTVLDAALPRRLDVDVLGELLEGSHPIALIDWLKKVPFVQQQADAWIYRQAVRDVLLRHVRDEAPERWTHLHDRLAAYYERLGEALDREAPSRLREWTRQAYEMEALYHRLCQDPGAYLPRALDGFVARFGGDQTLAHHWAEVVQQAGQDAADNATRVWGERLLHCVEAFTHGRFDSAARTFGVLVGTGHLDANGRQHALAWSSRLLSAAEKFDLPLPPYGGLVDLVSAETRYRSVSTTF
jgi:hypothetical protein